MGASLERVYDETEIAGPLIHGEPLMSEPEIEGELTTGSTQVMGGALRMARAFEHARVKGTLEGTMRELGFEKSQAYSLASCWRYFGGMVLNGTLYPRVEGLSPSHLIKALRSPEPLVELEIAQDNKESSRQMEARMRGEEEPKDVETVELVCCPLCEGEFEMSRALVRTVER